MLDIPTVALTPDVRPIIHLVLLCLFLLGCLASRHPKLKAHPRRGTFTFAFLSIGCLILAPLFATDPNLREPAQSPIWENWYVTMLSLACSWLGALLARLAFKSHDELERIERKPLPPWAKAVQRPIKHTTLALVYLILLATFLPFFGGGKGQGWVRLGGHGTLVACASLMMSRASFARESRAADAEGVIKLTEEGVEEEEEEEKKRKDPEEKRRKLKSVRRQSLIFATLCGVTSVVAMGAGWVQFLRGDGGRDKL